MQVASSSQPFDAVIVGSGATGGWADKKLTATGMLPLTLRTCDYITHEYVGKA